MGLKHFWLEGYSLGMIAAGGAGRPLAEWIVEGEPTSGMLCVDPRRFGDYASKAYRVKAYWQARAQPSSLIEDI